MKLFHYSFERLRSSFPMFVVILIVWLFYLGVTLFSHFKLGIQVGELTRDPSTLGLLPAYAGFFSQIGIFFWTASITVCFFCARAISIHPDNREFRIFLYVSALLTLLLALDDVFMLHEEVFPHFGIPEIYIIGIYVGFSIIYLFRFYKLILETEYILMVIALFSFGISVTLDLIILELLNIPIHPYFFEDGAKFVGIVSWSAYFFRVGQYSLNLNTTQQIEAPEDFSNIGYGS